MPLNTLAKIKRLPRRADAFMIPCAVERAPAQFLVDATWGTITPMQLAPGVRTVGELETLAHIEAGLPLVGTRLPKYVAHGTLDFPRFGGHGVIRRRRPPLS